MWVGITLAGEVVSVNERIGTCPQTFERTMWETVNSAREWTKSGFHATVGGDAASNNSGTALSAIN
jgi:hypothetical protein